MKNLCRAIACPAYEKNGCSRYFVAGHCHLIAKKQMGKDFTEAVLTDPEITISLNEYWLFVEEGEETDKILLIKATNDEFFQQDKRWQRRQRRQQVIAQFNADD